MNTRFYMYFADEDAARAAGSEAEGEGFAVDRIDRGADEESWLLLLSKDVDDEGLDEAEERLQQLAQERGGEYDGMDRAAG